MDRLTRKHESGEFYIPRRYKDENGNNIVPSNQTAIDKLAHYEDLEEAGRLIELPCALYDVVWSIQPFKVVRSDSIGSFGYSEDGLEMWDWNGEWIGIFGKTAFLTKEEAEAKLKELEGDKE